MGFACGLLLPAAALDGDAGRLLITFLGLVSASILPTVSLILGSMTAGSRSVSRVDDLEKELSAAMDALFTLFGLVAVVVTLLVLLALPWPTVSLPPKVLRLPYALVVAQNVGPVLERLGQALVSGATVIVIARSGQIPGILRRSMALRHAIAVEEAKRATESAAPKAGDVTASFPTHPDFGRKRRIGDLGA